ncbi:nucleophosmin 1b isoform X1 [Hippoglossus hippoglossus]|uniref:nucleophosmin 1b n=1 Tax=Hippoglossus stenolepis TaxID=195615 RepID=UPI00148DAB22|nr:nucleophosmin 1b isoform X1 [Hippoglossus hippoglossus]XP_035017575.1 nucleophosmin 1b [Hippoglossus stenolepis]
MEDDISDGSRPQMYLFGCTLKSDKREFRVDVEDDDTEQQLSLKAVCLGAEAEDKFHMVEVEGLTYDGKTTKVPLVALKPSVLPSMSLGGFEITPPVTFRLQSGSGPVHISGQHFVSVKDSEDEEEENNSSPVKRPAGLMSGKKPLLKKLKMDSDDDDEEDSDEDDDDDDEDDDSDDDVVKPQKKVGKELEKSREFSAKKPNKTPVKQNGPAGKASGSAVKPQIKTPAPGKDKPHASPSKAPSLSDVKNKLSTAAKEGKPLPKTEQKFENFVKSSFKISDKKVVKDLWSFVQTLKIEKK